MKYFNKKVKYVLVTTATIFTVAYFNNDYNYNPTYEILDESDDAYAIYPKGKVYIGDKKYIESLRDVKDTDILVEDQRKTRENMKIVSSYKIKDKDLRNDIICILVEYEKDNPTDWDRTIESMRVEWFVHNFLYDINYEIDRTKDVDFQNDEEKTYNKKILRKLFSL